MFCLQNAFTGVFHLIEFTESKTAAVISSAWVFDDNKCCYPSSWDPSKVAQFAKRHTQPKSDWEVFDIRIKKTTGRYCSES